VDDLLAGGAVGHLACTSKKKAEKEEIDINGTRVAFGHEH
jgi:hypothetical protein